MRNRQNRWLWVIGLLLFLGMATHWGFQLYVKARLDELIRQARPQLEISYQEMHSSLLGRLQVQGVRLRGGSLPGPLQIEQLDIQGPTVFTYLLYNNPVTGTGPPRFIRLLASGLQMSLEQKGRTAGDECNLEGGIPPALLDKLGYGTLRGEATAGYRYRPELHQLESRVDLDIPGIQELAVDLQLRNVTPQGFKRGQLGTAALSEATVKLDLRPTFGKQLVEYCADKRQLTPAAFESSLARNLLDQLRRNGVIVGGGLESALQRYVENWGSLEVNLVPPVPMNLVFLSFVPSEQLHRKLGLEVLVNGDPVKGLRLGEARRDAAAVHEQPQERERFRPIRKRWLYQQVKPSELPAYVGRRVRLQERGDPARTGLLVDVANGEALVQQRLSGGRFMAYVSLAELVKAEVFVLKKVEETP